MRYKYIYCLVGILGLVGCKLETLSNGDFDGNWHMMQVDTLSNNRTTDVSEERIFWGVEGKLLQFRYIGRPDKSGYENHLGYFLRFSKSDTRLVLSEPRIFGIGEEAGDTIICPLLKDTTQLRRYGVYSMPEQYEIEELTSGGMTLRSETLRLHFRKQ